MAVGVLTIPCDVGEVSDGYHTFGELYDHRCLLFIALMQSHPDCSWYSLMHDDGSCLERWFIAGMNLRGKQISYHLPRKYWDLMEATGAYYLETAPKWDGHSSKDVALRLKEAINYQFFSSRWVEVPGAKAEIDAVELESFQQAFVATFQKVFLEKYEFLKSKGAGRECE